MEPCYCLDSYNYLLNEDRIAQHPSPERTKSRLLDFSEKRIQHRIFNDLLECKPLNEGKVLFVCNNTKVRKARLYGNRLSGGKVEALLFEQINEGNQAGYWKAFVKPARKLKVGEQILLANNYLLRLEEKLDEYALISILDSDQEQLSPSEQALVLEQIGTLPLPPYIRNFQGNQERYQTVFAKDEGAAAAPTAGLHFDSSMIKSLKEFGHEFCEVTLHVGPGTFKPIDTQDIRDYPIHREFISVDAQALQMLNLARQSKRHIVAIGTTSLRVIESAYRINQWREPYSGWTQLFLYPGQKIHACDYLITNFHLPCSSLLVLVASLIGLKNVQEIYQDAISNEYRFFSFGDTSILPNLSPCS